MPPSITTTGARSGSRWIHPFRFIPAASPWSLLAILGTGLVACTIVGSTLWMQSRAGSGIAYSDQWAWVAQYRHIVEHGLDFGELIAQNNEHRILFPRLVFLLDMALARGSDRANLLASDALLAVIFIILVWKASEAWPSPIGIVATLASAAFLGNAVQGENLYWGFQVQFVMVYAAAVASFALLPGSAKRGRAERFRIVASWGAATVATFSMANGVLVWPILCLTLALLGRKGAALITLGLGVAEAAAYLHGYQAVPNANHTGILQAVAHPSACLSYMLVYFGGLVSPVDVWPALAGGCALLAVAGALARWSYLHGAGSGPWRFFAAGVSLFVALSAVLTSIGRFSLGSEQALSARYITPGALIWSTLLLALAVETRHILSGRRLDAACLGLAAFIAAVAIHAQAHGIDDIGQTTADIQAAADAYAVGVRDDAAMSAVTDDHDLAWSMRPFLAEHGLGPFGQRPASSLGRSLDGEFGGRRYGPCIGTVDRVVPVSGPPGRTGLKVDGWAWGPDDGLPSAVVVADADDKIVGFARTGQDRPDVARSHPGGATSLSGYGGYVQGQSRGPLEVFAVSSDGRRLCPIGGIFR